MLVLDLICGSAQLLYPDGSVYRFTDFGPMPEGFCVSENKQRVAVKNLLGRIDIWSTTSGELSRSSVKRAVRNFDQGPWTCWVNSESQLECCNLWTHQHLASRPLPANWWPDILCTPKYYLVGSYTGFTSTVHVGNFSTGTVYLLQLPEDCPGVVDCHLASEYIIANSAYSDKFVFVVRTADGHFCWSRREDSIKFHCVLNDEVVITSRSYPSEFQCRDLRTGQVLSTLAIDLSSLTLPRLEGYFLTALKNERKQFFSLFDMDYTQ